MIDNHHSINEFQYRFKSSVQTCTMFFIFFKFVESKNEIMNSISRKNFLKMSALGFGALIVPNSLFAYEGNEPFAKKVRVGLIGVGMRGQNHIDVLAK